MHVFFKLFVVVVVAILASSNLASARERILEFSSNIVVNADGSLLVKETIKVRAKGRQIRRGIFRSFPVRHRNKSGYWRRVGFKVLNVTRDGASDNWFLKPSGDYILLYIGHKNRFLPHRDYTYEITYKTTRQLRYFKDYDELYWNVTGDKWSFPIDHARTTIHLPDQAVIKQFQGYTGRFGVADKNFRSKYIAPNTIFFETIKTMPPRHGLTVALGWQKGIVPTPSYLGNKVRFLLDNSGLVALVFGGLFALFYFLFTWLKIGRDPKQGVIIPLFSAPEGFSPAAVSYIHYRKLKGKGTNSSMAFIAALVSLAVKGRLVIDKRAENVLLRRSQSHTAKLPLGEQAIFSKLLGSRSSIEFKQSTASTVGSARVNFRAAVLEEHGNVYFHNNIGYFMVGLVISIIAVLAFGFLQLRGEAEVIPVGLFLIACAGATALAFSGVSRLLGVIPGGASRLMGLVLCVGAVGAGFAAWTIYWNFLVLPTWMLLLLAILIAANVIFYWLLHAPTAVGRQIMDQIEGFKLYLSVAEAGRMNMAGAPEVSPQVFEKFLPYAIALGVEEPWSKALEGHLAKLKTAGKDVDYQPHWYSGRSGWRSSDLGSATAGLVSGVAAGMAEATPPASSGSSSGGFSGGGGGGGGGGGW